MSAVMVAARRGLYALALFSLSIGLLIIGCDDDGSGPGEARPEAEFAASPRSGPCMLVVDFTDMSTGKISSWLWQFGDGNEEENYGRPDCSRMIVSFAPIRIELCKRY